MNGWERSHFEPTNGRHLVHYVEPGTFGDMPPLSHSKYRSGGPRTGWELTCVTEAAALAEFTTGLRVAWNWLEADEPDLAPRVRAAPIAMVLRAEGPDGQEAFVKELPTAMVCRHGGSLDDVDFNNVHLEMAWPADDCSQT